MTDEQIASLFSLGFLVAGLVFLILGVRGLLGFAIRLPTKFSGLKRFTGRSARYAGGVALFFGVVFLCLSYAVRLG